MYIVVEPSQAREGAAKRHRRKAQATASHDRVKRSFGARLRRCHNLCSILPCDVQRLLELNLATRGNVVQTFPQENDPPTFSDLRCVIWRFST
jgi:hypothetical protein